MILSLQQPAHRMEELVSKYVSNVHAKPQKNGGSTSEIKRTMKASRIQRDVVSCTLCIIMVSIFTSWDKADLLK